MLKWLQAPLILFFLLTNMANSSETDSAAKNNSTIDLGKIIKLKNQKYLMTPPKTAKKIFDDHLKKIDAECCEDDYPRKDEINLIKNILEDCLNKNCHKKLIPLYDPKKPPLKILAFKESLKLDDLILDHEKFKYDKLNENLSNKIKNKTMKGLEKDEILVEFKKENENLKKTVDKMLVNYQKKISKLENDNKELKENFDKAFNMLPAFKQKKFNNN